MNINIPRKENVSLNTLGLTYYDVVIHLYSDIFYRCLLNIILL